MVCGAGYVWNEASRLCSPCPAGYIAPYAAMAECEACPKGSYGASAGQVECEPCPEHSWTSIQAATGVGDCACQLGFVGIGAGCEPCPTGASCPGGTVIRAEKGWCQNDEVSSSVLPTYEHCCDPDECPGGAGAKCDDSVALLGAGNDCAVRYLSWDTINQVSLSAGTWASIGAILGMSLVIMLVLGFLFGHKLAKMKYQQLKPGPPTGRAKIGVDAESPVPGTALAPTMMAVEAPVEAAPPSWLPTPDGRRDNDIFTPRAAPAAADGTRQDRSRR